MASPLLVLLPPVPARLFPTVPVAWGPVPDRLAPLPPPTAISHCSWGSEFAGDILLYSNHLVLYKSSIDLTFYVVGPEYENELMLQNVLYAFHDAVSLLLRHQVEKRSVLENLDLVVLALDETIDDG